MNAVVEDVVTVPDFSADLAGLFEARTLFFLAAWLESRDAPGRRLRLCCIGEPPANVRRLAEHAGAAITVHAPVPGFWGGLANKLRGLEDGQPGGRRLLLLDVDVLIVNGLGALDGIGADFAVAAAGKPQVPLDAWKLIYEAVGVPLPTERIPALRARLGLGMETILHRYTGQGDEAAAMLPYYNSGVLLARGGSPLRERWEAHLHRVLRLADGRPELAQNHAVLFNDQVGLATALQSLRAEGRTFALLPDACNTRLIHLRAGALRWRDLGLFHATGFLRGLESRADLPRRLEEYAARWSGALMEGAAREPALAEDAAQPRRYLQHLWERWVRPEWEGERG